MTFSSVRFYAKIEKKYFDYEMDPKLRRMVLVPVDEPSIRKRIEHDLYYVENWNLFFDIKIMFLTLFKGFINKNAY